MTDHAALAAEKAAEARDILEVVDSLLCESPEDEQEITRWLQNVKADNTRLEEMKQTALAPLRETEKTIRSWFSPAQDAYKAIEGKLKQKVVEFRQALERERTLARVAIAEAASKGTPQQVVTALATLVATEPPKNAAVVMKKVWDFELLALDEVPPEYLALNSFAVKAAIAEGVREIPGVRIFQKDQVSVKK